MIWVRTLLGLGVALFLISCAFFIPKETRYLQSVQDRATQDDVKQEMGPPRFASAQVGETVWVYQLREEQSGSRMTAPGLWCDEYALTFDDKGVLRKWMHKSRFHGGERMPTYCVEEGHHSQS